MSNLFIYIKTPPVGYSNICAHLVEHCVLYRGNLSAKDFYDVCDIKGESYFGYTRYDIHKSINPQKFIQMLCKPLDKKVFAKEMLALKQETAEEIFPDILRKKVENMLYGTSSKGTVLYPTWAEVIAYHTTYYKKNILLICDSGYTILENNLAISSAGKRSLTVKKQDIVSINGEKNKVTILPYTHRKSHVLLYFIEFLYDTYMEYTQRHMKGIYDSPASCMLELAEYVCIAIPQRVKYQISSAFLEEAKKHFCSVSLHEYARKIEVINLLYIGQLPSDKDVKAFIQSIDSAMVKKVLG